MPATEYLNNTLVSHRYSRNKINLHNYSGYNILLYITHSHRHIFVSIIMAKEITEKRLLQLTFS